MFAFFGVIAFIVVVFLIWFMGSHLARLFPDEIRKKGIAYKVGYWLFVGVASIAILYGKSILVGVYLYLLLFYVLWDIVLFISKKCGKRAYFIIKKGYLRGITAILMAILVSAYGYWNAGNDQVTSYDVQIRNKGLDEQGISMIMASDLHVGTTVKEKQLQWFLDEVNKQKPDLVLLCGDIFDENSTDEMINQAIQVFSQFETTYGVFYVTGNHEYYRDGLDEIIDKLKANGITPLLDETVLVNDSFYLVGRIDKSAERVTGEARKSIEELLYGIDFNYPVIMMDHQPVEVEEKMANGVDLSLSGHTHAGQIFPGSLFSEMINEMNYGIREEKDKYAIVSSGLGTWGFQMRTGSKAEIVSVNVHQ